MKLRFYGLVPRIEFIFKPVECFKFAGCKDIKPLTQVAPQELA